MAPTDELYQFYTVQTLERKCLFTQPELVRLYSVDVDESPSLLVDYL